MRIRELEILEELYGRMHSQSEMATIGSWRSLYARGFFDKARLHISSLLLIIRSHADNSEKQFDIGGICSLARCIIEAHNAYYYLLEPRLSLDEQEFRHDLFLTNQTSDLERIQTDLGIPQDDFGTFFRQASLRDTLARLEKNPSFQGLPPDKKKKARAGRSPYLTERYGGKTPVPPRVESAIYNLLSHSVHSFGLGINPLSNGRNTAAGALNVVALALDASLIYGARIAKKYLSARHKAMPDISDSDRTVIIELSNPQELEFLLKDMTAVRSI
jgi:hypothetical protein